MTAARASLCDAWILLKYIYKYKYTYKYTQNMQNWLPHEISNIERLLVRGLGPEYISQRPAPGGGRVPYLEGRKAIELANDLFGFNGWRSEVRNVQVDYFDDHDKQGPYDLGLSATVRVTLKDGSYHEDIGYAHAENVDTRFMAFEKCKKEAVTDGMKRALRCFGNVLGNCLYNRNFTKEVLKMPCSSHKIDLDNLYRQPELASNPHSHLSSITSTTSTTSTSSSTIQNIQNTNSNLKTNQTTHISKSMKSPSPESIQDNFDYDFRSEDILDPEFDLAGIDEYDEELSIENELPSQISKISQPTTNNDSIQITENHNQNILPSIKTPIKPPIEIVTPIRFFSARAAEAVQNNSPIPSKNLFNPSFQSPSMRRTLDQSKSAPIKRTQIESLLPSQSPSQLTTTSPSIVRTLDQSKSAPVKKSQVESLSLSLSLATQSQSKNIISPSPSSVSTKPLPSSNSSTGTSTTPTTTNTTTNDISPSSQAPQLSTKNNITKSQDHVPSFDNPRLTPNRMIGMPPNRSRRGRYNNGGPLNEINPSIINKFITKKNNFKLNGKNNNEIIEPETKKARI